MWTYPELYELIVIGAGHAGCEAAYAAAKRGAKTLLLTMNLDTIAKMSCNPAIGGIGKGHMVREIDALGGLMAKVIDETAIQFRMLNATKGPAVFAPRAQADKVRYQFSVKKRLEQSPHLEIKQGSCLDIICNEAGEVCAVDTSEGIRYQTKAIVLSGGTFMQGLMHLGEQKNKGGRAGDQACTGLSKSLSQLGLKLGRLKTGTPPRIHRRSIDFSQVEEQKGEEGIRFSYQDEGVEKLKQVSCYITYTRKETNDIIRKNLHRSAMYSGSIQGIGPRYCPSIEDKVVRFADKERHQVFLEPEGLDTEEFYINGMSTSMPFDVQLDFIRSIIGLEKAEITRPAYAIEYDYVESGQIQVSLECKKVKNLYLAGQINGTTGYEEAASQGLMAGINAALKIQEREPFILSRSEAYIGVLIDDLITKGTEEPYRMFTSRAEYRTLLRQDNADFRLTPKSFELGLASEKRMKRMEEKQKKSDAFVQFFTDTSVKHEEINPILEQKESSLMKQSDKMFKIFSRPNITIDDMRQVEAVETYIQEHDLDNEIIEQAEIQIKYSGYIEKEKNNADKLNRLENIKIPKNFDYSKLKSMSMEAREKLNKIQPVTISQASRISGVSPSDVSVLLVYMGR